METKAERINEKHQNFEGASRLSRPNMYSQPENPYDTTFWAAVALSQMVGLTCVALVIYWMKLDGGFAWHSDVAGQFSWHPVLMVLGLIFCFGDAIIIYRVLNFLPKKLLKIIHACFHLTAIICNSVALVAILENHRRSKPVKADFYSLHSWLGIATIGFFNLQYIGSFIAFLFPGVPMSWRARIMPFHLYFGLGLFLTACGTALMGTTEKLLWTTNYTKGYNPKEGIIGNILGLGIVVFAGLIVFIATHANYKRRPLPDEIPAVSPMN